MAHASLDFGARRKVFLGRRQDGLELERTKSRDTSSSMLPDKW